MPERTLPNIVITGTPGVGKTTTCTELISQTSTTSTPFKHLSINTLVKDKGCHEGYDEELKTWIVDEDKILDEVEKILEAGEGGYLIDWHVCDLFPPSWVDLVIVLRCEDTQVMFDRLKERQYNEKKLQENIDAEIFGVISEEAMEGFDADGEKGMVIELKSENLKDVDENVGRILAWVEHWAKDHGKSKG